MVSFHTVMMAINILLLPFWLIFYTVWVAGTLSFALRRPIISIPLYVAVYVDTSFYDRGSTTHHAIQRCLESTPWNAFCCVLAIFTALLVCFIGCRASRAAANALLLAGVLAWLSLVASLAMMKQGEGETILWPFVDVVIVGALATVPDITEGLLVSLTSSVSRCMPTLTHQQSILLRIYASELVNSSSLSLSEELKTDDLTPFIDSELTADARSNMIFQKTVIAFGAGIVKTPSDPWKWKPLSWRNQLHLVLALGAPLGFLRCLWPRYLAITQSLPLYGTTDKEWLVFMMIIIVVALRYWDNDSRDPQGREEVEKESV
jgi:hypothetical protein